jgi:transposase
MAMAKPLLPNALWDLIEPLLPEHLPRPKGGRPPIPDHQALTGILFVLKTGIPWEYLPCEMGCGSGMTCWRRLRAWQRAGVWAEIHRLLLNHLRGADRIYFSRFIPDSTFMRAVGGGTQTGPSPVDRSKLGSKMQIIVDAQGVPLAQRLTGANVPDVTQLMALVEAVPPIAGKVGHPRRRPQRVQADRGYDAEPHRTRLRRMGIEPLLGKRHTGHGSGLGVFRWVVERTISWFKQFRRLRVRYERYGELFLAFWQLAAAIICFRFLSAPFR